MSPNQILAQSAAKDFALQKFGKDLLNVADTMEMALANAPREDIEAGSNPAAATMLEGMEGINRMLLKTFTVGRRVQKHLRLRLGVLTGFLSPSLCSKAGRFGVFLVGILLAVFTEGSGGGGTF